MAKIAQVVKRLPLVTVIMSLISSNIYLPTIMAKNIIIIELTLKHISGCVATNYTLTYAVAFQPGDTDSVIFYDINSIFILLTAYIDLDVHIKSSNFQRYYYKNRDCK
jgi:hypothetical protein